MSNDQEESKETQCGISHLERSQKHLRVRGAYPTIQTLWSHNCKSGLLLQQGRRLPWVRMIPLHLNSQAASADPPLKAQSTALL